MAKVRVYELAKELGLESKELLQTLNDMGEFVRSASSTIEAPVVRRLKEKAAAAGAIETMAYELGAGLGIALFGLILTRSYSASIALPSGLSGAMAQQAASSIGEAVSLSQALPAGVAQALMAAAKTAFIQAHSLVLATAGVLLLLLAAGIWRSLATVAKPQSAL